MKNNKQPFHRKTSLIPRKSRLSATKTQEGDETIRKPVANTLQKTTRGNLSGSTRKHTDNARSRGVTKKCRHNPNQWNYFPSRMTIRSIRLPEPVIWIQVPRAWRANPEGLIPKTLQGSCLKECICNSVATRNNRPRCWAPSCRLHRINRPIARIDDVQRNDD